MLSALVTTITAGVLALGLIVSITVLTLNGNAVPVEFPTLLSGLVGSAIVGAAIQQGASKGGGSG